MNKLDLKTETQVALALIAGVSGTTPAAGNIVDVSDCQAATLVLLAGDVSDAGDANGFSFEVQESDTTAASDFTAVADKDLVGTESALTVTSDDADNAPIGSIGYIGNKRYVRVVVTGTTGSNAVVVGAWVLQKPRYSPAAETAANIAAT